MIFRKALPFIAVLLLMVSCDTANDANTHNEQGTLQVYLTDAPGNYEAVWIDIKEVRIHLNEDDDLENDDEGWITISEDPLRINLLDLTNGELEILGEAQLESGTYSQIRLILGPDNEIVKNGITHHLDTPSAQESGLKINVNAHIEEGEVYTLLLDFDASRSIVEAGKSGKFLLKPVIRTVALEETGAIEGSIEPAESLPWIYAIAGEDTVAGTKAAPDGGFRIVGLLDGTYDIAINPSVGAYPDSVLTNVEVFESDTTQLGVILLEE